MHTSAYTCIIEELIVYIKTKIVRVGLYEKPFFAQLATEDTCAVGVAYIGYILWKMCW